MPFVVSGSIASGVVPPSPVTTWPSAGCFEPPPPHAATSTKLTILFLVIVDIELARADPPLVAEPHETAYHHERHQPECHRITPRPLELRHVLEVHAPHAGDERDRHHHCRDQRQLLHDVVHPVRLHRQVR